MGIREKVSEGARVLKEEHKYSYSDLECLTGLTRKQISDILKGRKGVSFDKIETFFFDAFDAELDLVVSVKL